MTYPGGQAASRSKAMELALWVNDCCSWSQSLPLANLIWYEPSAIPYMTKLSPALR